MKDEITVADDLLFHTVEKLKQLDNANLTDDQERTRRELAIYKGYFDVLAGIVKNPHSDGKTETAREYVGQHIHPGYTGMIGVIELYTNDALNIPTPERLDLVRPIGELMLLIGIRWNDANNAALNVRACFDDVQDKIATLDDVQTMTNETAARFMADIDTLRQTLRQRLIELSAVLKGAPASGVDSETLATVQDVAHNVRAARAEIADSEERTQNIIHQRSKEIISRFPTSRADKGKKHTTRKNRKAASVDGVKHTAAWLAGVLNKSRFQPEQGAHWIGKCDEAKINRWDATYYDAEHTHPICGYYAALRTDAGLYNELMECISEWHEYYETYKTAFKKWRLTHRDAPRSDFRPPKPRRTDIDTARIGRDEQGDFVIEPRTDQERKNRHR